MINGFVVIDKPAGITSHDVVSRVRRILGTRKVGHTGTLDPFATGVLPVAVNDGTKAIPFLDEGVKCYEALLRIGVTTDTLDMTGTVLSESDPSCVNRIQFQSCLAGFSGLVNQVPPMYSAIKQGGQPLYKFARKGQEVERKARQVLIHTLELLSFDSPLAAVRVTCSRGTYVRSLADDIGRHLGCGAALQELRRLASGPFRIESSITLADLEQAAGEGKADLFCLSPTAALGHLQEIILTEAGFDLVRHGRSPGWEQAVPAAPDPLYVQVGSMVRLIWKHELIAVAELAAGNTQLPDIVLKRVFV